MELMQRTTIIMLTICFMLTVSKRTNLRVISQDKDQYRYSMLLVVLFVGVLIFVEGFRYGYQDTLNYKGDYQYLSNNIAEIISGSEEPGFGVIQWLLRKISTHPQFLILVCAAFFNIADVKFIKKYSNNLSVSLFLYFIFSIKGNCNGLRQLIAATFLMLAFPLLLKKKYILYIVLIILLSTIHRSILVMIPLMFLFTGKRYNIGIIGFVAFCAFSTVVPGPINALIGALVTDDYSHYLGLYVGANVINVYIEAAPFLLGILYHSIYRGKANENREMDILINMQAIRFGFMMLATTMAQYARIGMYMKNVTAILVPFLIAKVFRRRDSVFVQTIALVLYFAVFTVENRMLAAAGAFDVFYLDFSIFN